ncbi:MAG: urate hydroxylase PuuD [Cyclobacteriaceae bacterium]|nr:urate hydroxylase PuuD [Cyclobacteriaceae bacterium]
MISIFIIVALVLSGIIVYLLTRKIDKLSTELAPIKDITEHSLTLKDRLILTRQIRQIIMISTSVAVIGFTVYFLIAGTPMQGFVMEWLNLLVRWVHVVAGIMWIGASFYFIFLENNLNRTDAVRDELAGNLWAIHGGGFYFLEKYKVAPKELPKNLHWFKYEAYFTWLSGFTLLTVVYYMDAKSFLIDPQTANISVALAITIGISTLIIGWLVYDGMCKSPLVKNIKLFSLIGFVLLVGVSFLLTQVFTSRAAYIHIGALIGTIMAANVYFIIIPSQKALVRAAMLGKPLDPTLGQKAGQRSLHNNYLTLPVIFIMISNHFPSTYGHAYNWIILMVITLASAGIKHYWNLIERGERTKYILPVSVIALLSLVMVTSPLMDKLDKDVAPVSFQEVQTIINARCIQCHSVVTTDDQWTIAPNNIVFDTPNQIKAMADRMMIRVSTNTMPLGNKTNMTNEEREVLKIWILQGAKIN